jgi:N-methylhydantoinase A
MTAQGVARHSVILERHAELRAKGQTAEVGVELPVDLDATGIVELLPQLFAKQHLETFGHAPTGGVELLSLRLRARVAVGDTAFADLAGVSVSAAAAGPAGERTVYFGRHGGSRTVPVLDRWRLDDPMPGPLVVEEPDATVVVPPNWTAARDDLGSIVITKTG